MKTELLRRYMILILVLWAPSALLLGQSSHHPTVVTTGMGVVQVAPDEASIQLGVTRQSSTAQLAQEAVSRVIHDVVEALREAEVPERRIRSSAVQVNPIYASERVEGPRISGYQADSMLTVRVFDLQQLGSLIDAALQHGANRVQGVQFSLQDDRQAREEALESAVRDARMKAAVMARAADRELGPIQEIREDGAAPAPMAQYRMAAEAMSVGTTVLPGEVEVSARVTVTFHLLE